MPVADSFKKASLVAQHDTEQALAEFLDILKRRKLRDAKRIGEYYDGLRKEAESRPARRGSEQSASDLRDKVAAIEAEAQAQAICMQTKDYERAYEAFVGKTRPVFKGN